MKKIGFTLAEILITMGIIGVVAALTAPTLVNNAANAQIRPTLAKAVETLENANLALINAQELNSLRDLGANLNAYLNGIVGVMSGAVVDNANNTIHMKGNIDLIFNLGRDQLTNGTALNVPSYDAQGGLRGPYCDVTIDIDGVGNNNANDGGGLLGNDLYRFVIDGSGTVLPYGGRALQNVTNGGNPAGFGYWNPAAAAAAGNIYKCNAVGDAAVAMDSNQGIGCAGAVFEDTQIRFR